MCKCVCVNVYFVDLSIVYKVFIPIIFVEQKTPVSYTI